VSVTVERVAGIAEERRARAGERLLACEGLFHLYMLEGREVVALQGVDFGVDWGEMVALLGPSGSGKSTMLAILGGLERPSAGRVVLDGIDVSRLSEAQLTVLRRRRLGFVWQGAARNLLPHASAWENLDLPMVLAGLPAGRRRRRAKVLLDAVDLGAQRGKPIRALSGGEQQRLAVAVALANNPPLLLADEPTSQLDRANVRRVVELLKEAREDLGTTVVVVTHDAEVAAAMDRTVTIRDGRVSAEGRGGAEYAVVGPTGSLHLPAHALEVLPPGSRVVVEVGGDQVVLKPTDDTGGSGGLKPGPPAGSGARGGAAVTSLAADRLVARRGGRNVVDGVSLEVHDGQVVGLVGPSGSGKSTTLLLLAGLEPPDAGVVRLDGEDLAGLGQAGRQALRRDRVALVFQGYGLLSLLTARENVELPFRVARRDPAAAATAATRWLGLLGLGDRADQRTDQLSGGERQRVALARALAVEPAVLLVDEPTAELDEENRDRAVGLLRDAADRGAAVVVATHDPEVVDLCDRVVRLVDGRPVELTPGEVGGPVA
jgi:ABC-type lipoprotein export system ATPase subunit